jgi:hypothetical protein
VTIVTKQGEGGMPSSMLTRLEVTANGGHALGTSLKVSPNVKLSSKAGKGAHLEIE